MSNLQKLLAQTDGIRPGLTGCEEIRCQQNGEVWNCSYGAPETAYNANPDEAESNDYEYGFRDGQSGAEPQDGQGSAYYDGYSDGIAQIGGEPLDEETVIELQSQLEESDQ